MEAYPILAIFILLQALDAYTTKRGMDNGKVERNPVGRWFMRVFGVVKGLIIEKAIGCVLIIGLFVWVDSPFLYGVLHFLNFTLCIHVVLKNRAIYKSN